MRSRCHTDRDRVCELAAGDRIAQLVVVPSAAVEPVDLELLSDSARGAGGLGAIGAWPAFAWASRRW